MELEKEVVLLCPSGLMKFNGHMAAHLLHLVVQNLASVDHWKNGTMGNSVIAME